MHLVALVVRLSGLDWENSGLHGYIHLAGTTIQLQIYQNGTCCSRVPCQLTAPTAANVDHLVDLAFVTRKMYIRCL